MIARTAHENIRIQSLDGLRALSIGLVLIAHLVGTPGSPEWLISLNSAIDIGNLGVRTFFVISGYLITSLLLREEDARGTVELRRFYVRRALRIFPAFYVYLFTVWLAAKIGLGKLGWPDLVSAATYTINYLPEHGFVVSHLWSLAVEEQFYLVWPFLIAFLSSRQALRVAVAVIVVCPLLRVLGLAMGIEPGGIDRRFEFVVDALAMGCVLAGITAGRLPFRALSERAIAIAKYAVWIASLALLFTKYSRPYLWYGIGIPTVNIALALVVGYSIRAKSGVFVKALNLRPLVLLGMLSYSLYLWQQPFLDAHHHRWYSTFPLNLAMALAVAILSYGLVERPILHLRDKIVGALLPRLRFHS